jgi:LEA14-like dessication related protein
MTSFRHAAVAGLVCLATMLCGCAAMTMKSPEVALAGVTIEEFGLREQRLGLKLRVSNPNDADLPIDGVSFTVDVNGQKFATGVSTRPVTVPRFGEALLDLSAVSTLGSLMRQYGELARGGRETVEYRIHGRFNGGGWSGVPFDSKREFKLSTLPQLLAPRQRAPSDSL